MKKVICFLVLFSSFQFVWGQNSLGIQAGVKVGVNFSQILDQFIDSDFRAGPIGGVWMRVHLPIWGLYLQPEISIGQSGERQSNIIFTDTTGFPRGEGKLALKITNVEMPILIGKRFQVNKLGLRVQAGPVLVQALNSEVKVTDPEGESFTEELVLPNEFRVGVQVGLALDIKRFTLDARYHGEITDLFDNSFNRQVSAAQLTLAYRVL